MNILIVGGAGYLGGAITDLLMHSNHNILVYDLLLYEETYRKQVPFVYGDIRDSNKIKQYLDWADVVIWLAALVGDPACGLNETMTKEINTDSVRCLRDNYKGRIIYTSTCSVYGMADTLLEENASLQPLSLYAQTKLWSEEILKGTNSLTFRLGTLYGVGDEFSRIRFDLVLNTLVMRAIVHGKIMVFDGRQYRPLIHVRDVASLICNTLVIKNTGIYNLHSVNVTIIELAQCIKKYFPSLQIDTDELVFQDNRNYRVSSQKAASELGFKPTLTLEDGIKELKKLLEEGRIKDYFLTRFSNYLYLKPLLHEYKSPLGKAIEFNI